MKVYELIPQLGSTWDIQKVEGLLNPAKTTVLLSIPLSYRRLPDGWMWKRERNGIYSVRSEYKILYASNENNATVEAHYAQKILWKIKTLLKMLHFMWNVLSNCLPIKTALLSRQIINLDSLVCPLCNGDPKDAWHLLIECSQLRMFGGQKC